MVILSLSWQSDHPDHMGEEGEEIQQQEEEEGAGGGADYHHAYNNENADADEDDFNGHEHASQVPAHNLY
jgi:hypothetical protein